MRLKGKKFQPKRSRLGTVLLVGTLCFLVLAIIVGSILYYILHLELPSIAALKDYRPSIATRVYAENNELIDEFFMEDRKIIKLSEVPKVVI